MILGTKFGRGMMRVGKWSCSCSGGQLVERGLNCQYVSVGRKARAGWGLRGREGEGARNEKTVELSVEYLVCWNDS